MPAWTALLLFKFIYTYQGLGHLQGHDEHDVTASPYCIRYVKPYVCSTIRSNQDANYQDVLKFEEYTGVFDSFAVQSLILRCTSSKTERY